MSNYGHGNLYKPEERFWNYVYIPSNVNDCWEWTGGVTPNGYGRYTIHHNVRTVAAHRFSYELKYGKPKKGLLICHKCNNRKCVNPKHLYAGTNKDNMHDREISGNTMKHEKHWKAKLTEKDVEEIRRLYSSGLFSQTELGDEFGVAQTMISRIVLNKNWI
jgi:hypothetical protein